MHEMKVADGTLRAVDLPEFVLDDLVRLAMLQAPAGWHKIYPIVASKMHKLAEFGTPAAFQL